MTYAEALRLHLLSLPTDAPTERAWLVKRAQFLLRETPPDYSAAVALWRELRSEPGDAPRTVGTQLRRWISGQVACRVERWQPPGYEPPPLRHGPKKGSPQRGGRRATPEAAPAPTTTP